MPAGGDDPPEAGVIAFTARPFFPSTIGFHGHGAVITHWTYHPRGDIERRFARDLMRDEVEVGHDLIISSIIVPITITAAAIKNRPVLISGFAICRPAAINKPQTIDPI